MQCVTKRVRYPDGSIVVVNSDSPLPEVRDEEAVAPVAKPEPRQVAPAPLVAEPEPVAPEPEPEAPQEPEVSEAAAEDEELEVSISDLGGKDANDLISEIDDVGVLEVMLKEESGNKERKGVIKALTKRLASVRDE